MSDHFPREILVEILHRLSLKSLVRCTSICKAWNSLITDHGFISDHLDRTIRASKGNGSLFLQLYRRTREWPNKFSDYEELYSLYSDNQQIDHISFLRSPLPRLFQLYDYSSVVGTCNGLVCSADYSILDFASIVIWNPSIRTYVVLPKPIATSRTGSRKHERHRLFFGFGFDSRNKDYKVVRLVTFYNEQDTPQVEVYSLASRSWRSITVRAPRFFLSEYLWKISQMFVNGVLHWVVNRRSDSQIHNFILSFDVVEETFGELTLPQHLKESPFVISILGGGHSLSVVHTYSEESQNFFSIWVMKEYGVVESWTEVFRCDSKRYGGISTVLALISSGKVVLRLYSGAIVFLDPMNESMKALGDQRCFHAFIGHYVESLFLINKEPDVLSY